MVKGQWTGKVDSFGIFGEIQIGICRDVCGAYLLAGQLQICFFLKEILRIPLRPRRSWAQRPLTVLEAGTSFSIAKKKQNAIQELRP